MMNDTSPLSPAPSTGGALSLREGLMLQAAVHHRFHDGETAEAHFTGATLDEILDQLRHRLQSWDTSVDEATTIRIMTAEINGHA